MQLRGTHGRSFVRLTFVTLVQVCSLRLLFLILTFRRLRRLPSPPIPPPASFIQNSLELRLRNIQAKFCDMFQRRLLPLLRCTSCLFAYAISLFLGQFVRSTSSYTILVNFGIVERDSELLASIQRPFVDSLNGAGWDSGLDFGGSVGTAVLDKGYAAGLFDDVVFSPTGFVEPGLLALCMLGRLSRHLGGV